jgi:histidine triad (HIT) family protein
MGLDVPRLANCPFCEYLGGSRPCAFVTRGASVSSILNRTQYERGALLVMSNTHIESALDADETLLCEVYREARRLSRTLVEVLHATGINIFQNNGLPAGQTVPHYHVHVVPRYPTSDPGRRFREADFDVTPLVELHELARQLQAALA